MNLITGPKAELPLVNDMIEVRTMDNDLYQGKLLSLDETEWVILDFDIQWSIDPSEILYWQGLSDEL